MRNISKQEHNECARFFLGRIVFPSCSYGSMSILLSYRLTLSHWLKDRQHVTALSIHCETWRFGKQQANRPPPPSSRKSPWNGASLQSKRLHLLSASPENQHRPITRQDTRGRRISRNGNKNAHDLLREATPSLRD